MPTSTRNKRSGALVFHPTKEDIQQINDRRKIKDLEKELSVLKQYIINSLKEEKK